jgi:hypothetical protein
MAHQGIPPDFIPPTVLKAAVQIKGDGGGRAAENKNPKSSHHEHKKLLHFFALSFRQIPQTATGGLRHLKQTMMIHETPWALLIAATTMPGFTRKGLKIFPFYFNKING